MAHKITNLFKKKPTFPKVVDMQPNEMRDMFHDLSTRLDKVETTLEELLKKK